MRPPTIYDHHESSSRTVALHTGEQFERITKTSSDKASYLYGMLPFSMSWRLDGRSD